MIFLIQQIGEERYKRTHTQTEQKLSGACSHFAALACVELTERPHWAFDVSVWEFEKHCWSRWQENAFDIWVWQQKQRWDSGTGRPIVRRGQPNPRVTRNPHAAPHTDTNKRRSVATASSPWKRCMKAVETVWQNGDLHRDSIGLDSNRVHCGILVKSTTADEKSILELLVRILELTMETVNENSTLIAWADS